MPIPTTVRSSVGPGVAVLDQDADQLPVAGVDVVGPLDAGLDACLREGVRERQRHGLRQQELLADGQEPGAEHHREGEVLAFGARPRMSPLAAPGGLPFGPYDVAVAVFRVAGVVVRGGGLFDAVDHAYTDTPKSRRALLSDVFLSVDSFALSDDQRAGDAVFARRELFAVTARDDHRAGRHIAFVGDGLGSRNVDDVRRAGDDGVRAQHGFAADVCPLDHDAARADEAVVLDDDRCGLHGFQHAADTHAAREVDVLADLGARTDRGPRVHHRAGIDVGADVHVRGHQDRPRGDVGSVARHGVRHDAHAQLFVAVFELHLVVPLQLPGLHLAHGLDREVEDHGLLDPFVDLPFARVRATGSAVRSCPLSTSSTTCRTACCTAGS